MSIRRLFGKGEGVPRKDLAMAALGLEEGHKGFKGDRGSKGSEDEIVLNAEEVSAAKEAERNEADQIEGVWDRERMVAWAKTIGNDDRYNEAWVYQTFDFSSDGIVVSRVDTIDLSGTHVKVVPLIQNVRQLKLGLTKVTVISNKQQAEVIDLRSTPFSTIPPGLKADLLQIDRTQVVTIPKGLQVRELHLGRTDVKEIPTDKGSIEKIVIRKEQTKLRDSAEALGIDVEIW